MSIIEPKGKAVTRSFRIDQAWNNAIHEIAQNKGMSTSALLEQICRDYVLFYQWVETFKSIVFSPDTAMSLVEAIDEDTLRKIAKEISKETFRKQYLERGDLMDLHTVVFQVTDQMGRYANWFSVIEHEAGSHYFFVRQPYGRKWACFVEAFLSTLFSEVAGVEIASEILQNNIVIKLI